MVTRPDSNKARQTRHKRVRAKISGTAECPRLNVFRSLQHIYAQLIDDVKDRLLMELGDSDSEEERKTLTDWMISLSDMKEDLKKIRRAQQ